MHPASFQTAKPWRNLCQWVNPNRLARFFPTAPPHGITDLPVRTPQLSPTQLNDQVIPAISLTRSYLSAGTKVAENASQVGWEWHSLHRNSNRSGDIRKQDFLRSDSSSRSSIQTFCQASFLSPAESYAPGLPYLSATDPLSANCLAIVIPFLLRFLHRTIRLAYSLANHRTTHRDH